jgi:hypothetical protein
MQEIRDYIYGTLKGKWFTHLYRLPPHKHKWIWVSEDTLEVLEKIVQKARGGGEDYHIIGGVQRIPVSLGVWNTVTPDAPPPRIYDKICTPATIKRFGEDPSTQTYSTWGIWYDEPNWRLLGVGLPKVEDLEKLKLRGKFDMIRVCRYVPEWLCLESCEMKIWDREGNRIA